MTPAVLRVRSPCEVMSATLCLVRAQCDAYGKVAQLQLSIYDKVVVLPVHRLGYIPKSARRVLGNPAFLKVMSGLP